MASNVEIADVLLKYFPSKYKGVLVEVGAGHPVNISISLPFRKLKWNIISIEPIPEHCEEFFKMGFPVLEYACCSADKGTTPFKVSPNLLCCSGLEIKYAGEFGWKESDFKTIDVKAMTLNTILKKHHPKIQEIDILTVDAEGFEIEVMNGFDLEKFNPKIACIEGHESEAYMLERGYKLYKQIGMDKFFVKASNNKWDSLRNKGLGNKANGRIEL